jgi:hypothetical protein
MSKRLQVLLDEAELEEIRRVAARKRMTVAEWVRQSLRSARADEPIHDVQVKLEVLERARRHTFPSGDIAHMLAEIEVGYLTESGS